MTPTCTPKFSKIDRGAQPLIFKKPLFYFRQPHILSFGPPPGHRNGDPGSPSEFVSIFVDDSSLIIRLDFLMILGSRANPKIVPKVAKSGGNNLCRRFVWISHAPCRRAAPRQPQKWKGPNGSKSYLHGLPMSPEVLKSNAQSLPTAPKVHQDSNQNHSNNYRICDVFSAPNPTQL